MRDAKTERRHKNKYCKVTVDLGIAPIIALVILLSTLTLSWNTFKSGVIGNEHIKPYSVLILFMSLSYCCISLDMTELFEYIALKIIQMSNNEGTYLYFGFCAFASVLTVTTSNDIVILTLTPIICCMAHNSQNLDPMPLVISQFFLANIWSIALMIGESFNYH